MKINDYNVNKMSFIIKKTYFVEKICHFINSNHKCWNLKNFLIFRCQSYEFRVMAHHSIEAITHRKFCNHYNDINF